MAIPVIHSLVNNDGARVELPPWYQGENGWGNMAHPNVYADDQYALWPRGTRYVEGERVFYYGKYGGQAATNEATSVTATNGDDLLGKGLMNFAFGQDYASTYTYGADASSVVYIDTLVTTAEKADDYYSGGYITGKDTSPSDARMFFRRIVAHDYYASLTVGGTAKTLVGAMTVDQPLVNAWTALAAVLTPNPWKHVTWYAEHANQLYFHVLGFSMHNNPTATYNIWLQTYGPMGSNHVTNANTGASSNEVLVYCMADGSIQVGTDGNTDTYSQLGAYPVVGYTLPNSISESGSGQDEGYPMIYLTWKR